MYQSQTKASLKDEFVDGVTRIVSLEFDGGFGRSVIFVSGTWRWKAKGKCDDSTQMAFCLYVPIVLALGREHSML
jgi:hypothetical protein